MSRCLPRSMVAFLSVVFSLNLACASGLRPVPRAEIERPNEVGILGVTTHAGERVLFDVPKSNPGRGGRSTLAVIPHVRGDSLFASVRGAPYGLAVEEIEAFWVNPQSIGRTALLAGAVCAAAFVTMGLMAMSSW